jgi:hypothetical protein
MIKPLIDGFVFLATKLGLIPEWHAQNVLFRDVADVFKDYEIRRSLTKHTAFCSYKAVNPPHNSDLFKRRSFAFDFKLGEYLLFPLATRFAREFGFDADQVVSQIRELTLDAWKRFPGYFESSSAWYDYPERPLVVRGDYRVRQNPRFR